MTAMIMKTALFTMLTGMVPAMLMRMGNVLLAEVQPIKVHGPAEAINQKTGNQQKHDGAAHNQCILNNRQETCNS